MREKRAFFYSGSVLVRITDALASNRTRSLRCDEGTFPSLLTATRHVDCHRRGCVRGRAGSCCRPGESKEAMMEKQFSLGEGGRLYRSLVPQQSFLGPTRTT